MVFIGMLTSAAVATSGKTAVSERLFDAGWALKRIEHIAASGPQEDHAACIAALHSTALSCG